MGLSYHGDPHAILQCCAFQGNQKSVIVGNQRRRKCGREKQEGLGISQHHEIPFTGTYRIPP